MRIKAMLGVILFSVALIVACKKSNTNPGFTPNCTGAAKSFSRDVFPVFKSVCSGCHSNFSSYSQIYADRSSIRSRIVDVSMPQNGSASTTQLNNVVCWIDNGAPNN